MLAKVIEFNQVPNDLAEAVAARLQRQRYLSSAHRRFLAVLEEQALRTRFGSADVMRAQLERVLSIMAYPWVSLGIIPAMSERHISMSAGFWIFDRDTVRVEIPSAELTITQRSEIAVYEKRFAWLQESALFGAEARGLAQKISAEFVGACDDPAAR